MATIQTSALPGKSTAAVVVEGNVAQKFRKRAFLSALGYAKARFFGLGEELVEGSGSSGRQREEPLVRRVDL